MAFDVLSVESSYRHLPLGQMKKGSLNRYLWSVCQESDVADVEDHRLMSQLGCLPPQSSRLRGTDGVGVPERRTVWMCVSWRAGLESRRCVHSFFQPIFKDLLCMCQGFILGAEDTVVSKIDKKPSPSQRWHSTSSAALYQTCDPGKVTRSCSASGSSQSIRGIK